MRNQTRYIYAVEEAARQAARRNAIDRAEAEISEGKKRQAAAVARAELNQALDQTEAELNQAKRQLRVLRLCLRLHVLGDIKAEAARRQQVRAEQAAEQAATKHAAAAAAQANKATTRAAAKIAQAELNKAKRKLRVRHRFLEGIKRPRQLLKPIKPPYPSCASHHHARVLIQIRKYKNTTKLVKDQPCSPQESRSITWYRLCSPQKKETGADQHTNCIDSGSGV